MILALPSLRAIRGAYPGSYISLLASAEAAPIIEPEGVYDELIGFRRSPQRFGGFLVRSRWQELIWLAGLGRMHYDAVVVLQPLLNKAGALRLRSIIAASRVSCSFGRNTNGRGGFYWKAVEECFDSDTHEVMRALSVAALLGASGHADIGIDCDETARQHAIDYINKAGVERANPLIGINAGSFRLSNRWPVERFAEVANALLTGTNGAVILIGGPGEEHYEEAFRRLVAVPLISAIGKTSLAQLPGLLSVLDLLVTNDTGTMHVAAAVGVRTVAVFSAGDPRRVAPYAPATHARAINNHLCGRPYCGDNRCLLNVSVEQVLQACKELLGASG